MPIDTAALWPIIRKAALENAVKFKGRATPKAVLGSLMKGSAEARKDSATAQKEVDAIVQEINGLSPEEQEQELLKLDPNYHDKQQAAKQERKQARKELPELKDAEEGKVVTRMPPEPSKYNHLGHAMSFIINYLYAKKYGGECILRIDDTNPEKETQEFVDAVLQDIVGYLGLEPDRTVFASDHLPRFLQAAADLIKQNKAYTCSCPSESMSMLRREMQGCPCRDKQAIEIQKDWMDMIAGKVKEGELTLRLKIDMQHKNAVMRDPVIMRICTKKHYRQGSEYKVWPMYDFESSLMDSWIGVTHVMRSNEFDSRIELHNHIKELFDLPPCHFTHYGRYNIVGKTTQGREIRELIEKGKMIGWDDPRLLTLRALQRRGIVRDAYYQLAQQIGLSKTQTNLDFGVIAAINRNILDEEANRYFFIEEPKTLTVADWPADLTSVELKLHPHKQRGGRPLTLDGEFLIAKKDFDKITDGKVFRLIDTINLIYDEKTKKCRVHSSTIDEFKKVPKEEKHGLIHFLPKNEQLLKARLFTPEASYIDGVCEPTIAQLRPGNHVQFERVCFARLDAIHEKKDGEKTFTFWYTHE